ncbi:hypothetical protein ACWC4J_44720 [Streptomyces sp. NPDC001356]
MTDGPAAVPKDETPDPTGTREPVTGAWARRPRASSPSRRSVRPRRAAR